MRKTGIEAKRAIEQNHNLREGELRAVINVTDENIIIYGASSISAHVSNFYASSLPIEAQGFENPKIINKPFAELPSVLCGNVLQGEKLGLVGRTGKAIWVDNLLKPNREEDLQ